MVSAHPALLHMLNVEMVNQLVVRVNTVLRKLETPILFAEAAKMKIFTVILSMDHHAVMVWHASTPIVQPALLRVVIVQIISQVAAWI